MKIFSISIKQVPIDVYLDVFGAEWSEVNNLVHASIEVSVCSDQ